MFFLKHGVQIPRYYRTVLSTTLLTNSHFSEDYRAKNQFIDRVNKLKVFKVYILVQLMSDMGLLPS